MQSNINQTPSSNFIEQRRLRTRRLTETALMLGLATLLSLIKLTELPFGGTVTVFSMLPPIIIAYRYGFRWGVLSSITYGLLQLLTGMNKLSGITVAAVIGAIFLDYLLAFGMCALGGLFRHLKSQKFALPLAVLCACLARYIVHFLSGMIIWGGFAPAGQPVWLYSLTYNGTFMIPETIVCVIGAFLISLFLNFRSENITDLKNNNSIA